MRIVIEDARFTGVDNEFIYTDDTIEIDIDEMVEEWIHQTKIAKFSEYLKEKIKCERFIARSMKHHK